MNALKCRILGAMQAQILENARAIETKKLSVCAWGGGGGGGGLTFVCGIIALPPTLGSHKPIHKYSW